MIKITTEWTKCPLFVSVCSCQTLYQAMQLSRLSNARSGLFSEMASRNLHAPTQPGLVALEARVRGTTLSTPPDISHHWTWVSDSTVFFFLGLLAHFDGAHSLTTNRERLWRRGFSSSLLWILHVSSLTPDSLAGCGILSEVMFPQHSGGIHSLFPLPVLLVVMVPFWFPIFCMRPFSPLRKLLGPYFYTQYCEISYVMLATR